MILYPDGTGSMFSMFWYMTDIFLLHGHLFFLSFYFLKRKKKKARSLSADNDRFDPTITMCRF